jgi:hypothetical protein
MAQSTPREQAVISQGVVCAQLKGLFPLARPFVTRIGDIEGRARNIRLGQPAAARCAGAQEDVDGDRDEADRGRHR